MSVTARFYVKLRVFPYPWTTFMQAIPSLHHCLSSLFLLRQRDFLLPKENGRLCVCFTEFCDCSVLLLTCNRSERGEEVS